jgi:hypothetical protein
MFKLKIKTDNAAFSGPNSDDDVAENEEACLEECARILRHVADMLDGDNSVRIASYAWAHPWDGKEDRYSWYA